MATEIDSAHAHRPFGDGAVRVLSPLKNHGLPTLWASMMTSAREVAVGIAEDYECVVFEVVDRNNVRVVR